MVSLLNRFAWVISFLLAIIPIFIDDDLFIFSIIVLFFTKFVLLSRTSIENAVRGMIQSGNSGGETVPSEFSQNSTDGYTPFNSIEAKNPEVTDNTILDDIIEESKKDTIGEPIENHIIEPVIPDEPSALSIWIHNFFSDRPLAKIGGIMLFLGALFFLGLIFVNIGAVGRVLMGIMFGFFLVGVGVWLDNRGIITESRVLFGIGIAINYLTILFGRYLIPESDAFIGDGLATFSLLLNTGFAIALALVYRSKVLLGFAFIFAYLTPFLIDSKDSGIFLLSIYTTIITIAISIIVGFYRNLKVSDAKESGSIEYLEGIAVIGMTCLFSLATLGIQNPSDSIFIYTGLLFSVIALSFHSYTIKEAPIPAFIGVYIILLFSSFSIDNFIVLPFFLIIFLFLLIIMASQQILSTIVFALFGITSFVIALIGFWVTGSNDIIMLLVMGITFFGLFGILIIQLGSVLLSAIAIGGFGVITLLGYTSSSSIVLMDSTMLVLVKSMSTILLIGASIFTLRLKDATIFFMAMIMSGMMIIYPNVFQSFPVISIITSLIYLGCSLLIPYLLTSEKARPNNHSFLLASLPISTLVFSYAVYQFGIERFPGVAMGFLYILEAGMYLVYALVAGKNLMTQVKDQSGASTGETKSTLLVLFAIPLSLFTFSLAFVFRDVPSVMSLAWIVESSILYLVATRMKDDRIFFAGHLVLIVGLIKELTLVGTMNVGEWLNFGILIIMCASIFSSLYILRSETVERRMPYDVLHVISILIIGFGISRIIPSTANGWSLFGPAFFLVILSLIYLQIGKAIHHIFLNILLGGLCLVFLARFNLLNKQEILPILIQFGALLLIYAVGQINYFSKKTYGIVSLTLSLIGTLLISSLYVDEFFGTFAVSIYLAIIGTILIIRGITQDNPRLRTIGLYIGIFVLLKILGYDIWMSDGDLIIRVIALMVTGGLMIYLSQLYGKYVSRSWSEELSILNITGSVGLVDKIIHEEPQDIVDPSEVDPFVGDLKEEIKKTSISEYSGVIFCSEDGNKFMIKRASIIRLARYICNRMNKTNYSPKELAGAYDYVLNNIASTLPKAQLEVLLMNLKGWIDAGGSVEFVMKDK